MKKGFTLIELLAVIVILAVLALIATPIVLNIIDDSKKNATLRSSENYIKAIEFSIAKSVMENKRLNDGEYPIMSSGNICLGTITNSTCDNELVVEVAGETPESGTVTIKSRKIDSYEFTYASGFVVVNGEISEEGVVTLAQFILKQAKDNNYYYETTPDFSKVTADGEYGLYQAPDDLGTSYYFRGDTEDNYVSFGESISNPYYVVGDYWYMEPTSDRMYNTEEECMIDEDAEFGICEKNDSGKWQVFQDANIELEPGDSIAYLTYEQCENSIYFEETTDEGSISCQQHNIPGLGLGGDPVYWRIVRINGDGTIRMIYEGTEKVHNGIAHNSTIANDFYNDDESVSGMNYSGSNIQSTINKWYASISESYYIAHSIFCNDREIIRTVYFDEDQEEIETESDMYGYEYGTYKRLNTYNNTPSPKLTCTRAEDKLQYKIGLITADEVAMAGGVSSKINNTFYLYNGDSFWTISPESWNNWEGVGAIMSIVSEGLYNDFIYANDALGVRPVINLKADVKFTGDGSYDNPYVIVTD